MDELIRKLEALESRVAELEAVETGQWVFLTSPLTSTSWDGDSFSTTAKTLIDLSAVFNVPASVKAVLVAVNLRDSDSAATSCILRLAPNNTADTELSFSCSAVADRYQRYGGVVVPCDANGDIYYQITASGAGTMDVYLQVWGYLI